MRMNDKTMAEDRARVRAQAVARTEMVAGLVQILK
jgi:hypothetical protein